MATLTIKNLPDDLLEHLKKRALGERRSLNQEVIRILEQTVTGEHNAQARKEAAKRQVEAWRKLAGKWKSDKSAADEIALIYSARTRGRNVKL